MDTSVNNIPNVFRVPRILCEQINFMNKLILWKKPVKLSVNYLHDARSTPEVVYICSKQRTRSKAISAANDINLKLTYKTFTVVDPDRSP